jgi:hypothetical protein
LREPADPPHWARHFVYRSNRLRTTWKFRVGLVILLLTAAWLTRSWWTAAVARSLVCEADPAASDAILIENFDPAYLLYEHARNLRQAGVAGRVLVPVPSDPGTSEPKAVELATAEMLANLSRLGPYEVVRIREVEPISLNAARDVQRYLEQAGLRSVTVVAPLFRSRRSVLVYRATLGRAGIAVRCAAVEGVRNVATWSGSSHGVQEVAEQWLKLQYYRFYVLPFRLRVP